VVTTAAGAAKLSDVESGSLFSAACFSAVFDFELEPIL
jgi:hypothetical protein